MFYSVHIFHLNSKYYSVSPSFRHNGLACSHVSMDSSISDLCNQIYKNTRDRRVFLYVKRYKMNCLILTISLNISYM
jgi:hypothetical protein